MSDELFTVITALTIIVFVQVFVAFRTDTLTQKVKEQKTSLDTCRQACGRCK